MNDTLGIEIVDGTFTEYNISDGMRLGTLKEIKDGTRKKFQSDEQEPVFKFIYLVKDDGGAEVELTRNVTKKISFLKNKSNLYKDLRALAPKAQHEIFEDITKVVTLINKLKERATAGKVTCYVVTEKNEQGFTNIVSVQPLPDANVSATLAKAEPMVVPADHIDSFDDDDIPF